ncbi:MAG: MoaD/ThiS family protein [Gammaproteobacteria bacterium]|nr:MoaD/ThiS family protein [Gammaproteobacteria bacterium]
MSITVRYFASLGERLGRSESTVDFIREMTVNDVWRLDTAEMSMPANILAAVNMEYAHPDDRVHNGDEVAFFPPVTGGQSVGD